MAKQVRCPSCGASDYEKKDATHYQCNFCESSFVIEEKTRQTDVNDALNQMRQHKQFVQYSEVTQKKAGRIITLSISLVILAAGLGIFFAVGSALQGAGESEPGKIQEDGYWGASSVQKFYVFEGSRGPMIWMLLNQSSKGLDSAKYTLQLVDPVKDKMITEKTFITMTWNESFNFNNYLTDMISYNDEVYFLSEAGGLNVYDLYTGKKKQNPEEFSKQFKELSAGLVSAKNKYYKDAVELMTNDGFKYEYLPKFNRVVSEEEFNNYQKGEGLIGGFVHSEAPRQKLYYVISKQDTLRNDFSFSEYYLNQYLSNTTNQLASEKAYVVDADKIFFNVKYILRNKNQVVFAYTENVDKKSKAHIISYSAKDMTKPLWQIELQKIKGLEKAMAEDYYLRTHESRKEVAVWYESAKKVAFGVDLKTGKINWNYSID